MSKLAKTLSAAAGNAGGSSLYPEDVFSTFLYAGSNGARTIANGISLSDEGGLVWLKNRGAVDSHVLFDTVNGPQKSLASNDTAAGSNYSSYLSFPSAGTAGWNLAGATLNGTGTTWASWSWRKAKGWFDIQTYTGNGTAGRTIAHNLGSAPKFVLVKRTNTTNNWICWHSALTNTQYIQLNSTSQAFSDGGIFWNSTTPDATNLTLGSDSGVNGSGSTYVAYLFGEDAIFGEDGDEQICKMGSYTHDSSGNATINLGFEPQWVLAKASSTGGTWYIFDVMRGLPASGVTNGANYLRANATNAESSTSFMSISSTGFNVTGMNANETWIYMAIRRPMKVPEAGTEVFNIGTYGANRDNSSTSTYYAGFPVDMALKKVPVDANANNFVSTRMLGTTDLKTNSTAAERTGETEETFDSNTHWNSAAGTSSTSYSWMLKRAPKFMDVVAYTGNGTASTAQAHNLSVAPEMMWIKRRDSSGNWVALIDDGNGDLYKYQYLQTNEAFATSSSFVTANNSSSFTLGSNGTVNATNGTFIAYLFATLAGISKVGTYTGTGTGTTVNVDCGFSNGARFIIIKRTDAVGDWFVYDSSRGIVAGDSPYLFLNTTAAQVNTDYIDPLNAGFTVTPDAAVTNTLNVNNATYIFLAIA